MKEAKEKLIVALDVPNFEEARALVETLGNTVSIYKVGYQLFVAYGPFIVRYLLSQGKKVFLDLKFHDIPNTVMSAAQSAVRLGIPVHDKLTESDAKEPFTGSVFMMTVHTQGGAEMLAAAVKGAREAAKEAKLPKPLIVGVTVLTSDAPSEQTADAVMQRARIAHDAGLDGVVASAQEAPRIRQAMGPNFVIVTPGIRPSGADAGDQKRVETPGSAIKGGASFLVVGRPIVKAASPVEAAKAIIKEMAAA